MLTGEAREPDTEGWAREVCEQARCVLGPDRWRMLVMVYAEDLGQAQIAERLGISPRTVKAEIAASMRIVAAIIEARRFDTTST